MDAATDTWYDADVATFGDRLAAARDATGMTHATFAKRLGVKVSTIRKWEDDVAEPRANRLSMMAGILGVSMSWLITGVGDGVDAPGTVTEKDDLQGLMSELRVLRADLTARAEHVGRIEKRLRAMMHESDDA